jgi:hypothetical protein
LRALKNQLRTELERVEKAEHAQLEKLRPQTIHEADELEKKLEAALAELRGWRAELEARKEEKKRSDQE